MLNLRHSQLGVTLVELMIGLVIVGILFAMGAPAYSTWIKSQKVRAGAESILNGIQLARSTAVNNNAPARFNLCDTISSWQVLAVSSAAAAPDAADTVCGAGAAVAGGNEVRVQERTYMEGSNANGLGVSATSGVAPSTAAVIADDGSRSVTFNSFGRITPNADATNPIGTIGVGATGGARTLWVKVQTGGSVRMCDPNLSNGTAAQKADPRAC
jgi:type IV fimbrial biogenesis protein FimT